MHRETVEGLFEDGKDSGTRTLIDCRVQVTSAYATNRTNI
jgi:hypothetical protein